MKKILLLTLLLSGCMWQRTTVINQTVIRTERETTITEDHHTTNTRTVTPHPVAPPPVVIRSPAPAVGQPCGPFILPKAGDVPAQPNFDTAEDIDLAISNYVKALKQHIKSERKSVVDAYESHKKKCLP